MRSGRLVAMTIIASLGSVAPGLAQCINRNASVGGQVTKDRSFYQIPGDGPMPIADLQMEILTAAPGGGTRPADGNVRTNDQGRYVFDGLCPGEYFVQPVFDRDTLTIDAPGGEVFHWSRPVTLRLPPFLRGAANFTLSPLTEEITVRVFHPSNLGIPDVRVVVGPAGTNRHRPTRTACR